MSDAEDTLRAGTGPSGLACGRGFSRETRDSVHGLALLDSLLLGTSQQASEHPCAVSSNIQSLRIILADFLF
jgi:hypothetical protein